VPSFSLSKITREHKRSEATNVGCRPDVGDDPAQLSDTGLIVAIARGAHDALHEAYVRHGAQVHALARRVCSLSADEVTQEVFLRLWREPGRFEPGRGSLRTFLLTDAHNRAVDLVRSDTARKARESAEFLRRTAAGMDVEDTALARLVADDVWRRLSVLDGGQRVAIVLAYFGGYTYREVADLLEQPEGTIKSRIRNGLACLRHGLSGFTEQEDDRRSRAGGGDQGVPP
jgi:RNA polymerase sigma-70 factor, ECF subfamily